MAPNGTYADVAAGRAHDASWGAVNSLRRLDVDRTAEQTPLLSHEPDNDASADAIKPSVWEGEADFEGVVWWKKPSVIWLLPAFFLFALAIGGIVVPKANLILSLVCREYLVERSANDPNYIVAPIILGGSNSQCRDPDVKDKVSALVAELLLVLTLTIGIISAMVAPKLGSLSDQYGRTKILCISSLGAFFTEIFTILIATYPDQVNYRWLLLGAVFEGLCGSFTTGMAVSYAYAADCTAPPKRAQAFGYFHACLFGGIALGPLLAAVIFKLTHSLLPVFYVALGIHAFFILFLLFAIPESVSKKRQLLARERITQVRELAAGRNPSWYTPIYQAFDALKILYPTDSGTSSKLRMNLLFLAGIDTIMFGVAMGAVAVVILYVQFEFDWKTDDTSIFISTVNIVKVSVLVILLPFLNYIFRTRRSNRQRKELGVAITQPNSGSDNIDLYTIRFAVLMEIIGYLGYAMARNGTEFTIAGVITAFGGLGSPTLQSSLTKHVPHELVGSLLGATGFLHALSRIVCPLVFNLIYAKTVGKYTQAVFVVLTSCFALAFLFSWLISPHVYLTELGSSDSDVGVPPRTDLNQDALIDEEIAGI